MEFAGCFLTRRRGGTEKHAERRPLRGTELLRLRCEKGKGLESAEEAEPGRGETWGGAAEIIC